MYGDFFFPPERISQAYVQACESKVKSNKITTELATSVDSNQIHVSENPYLEL